MKTNYKYKSLIVVLFAFFNFLFAYENISLDMNNTQYLSLDENSLGDSYIAYADQNDSLKRAKLIKYNGFDVKNISTNINDTQYFSLGALKDIDIKFDLGDNLYLMYIDKQGLADGVVNVQKYDSSKDKWLVYNNSTTEGIFLNENPKSDYASMDLNSSGNPFVAYIDKTTNKINVAYLNFNDVDNLNDDTWSMLENSTNILTALDVSLAIKKDIPYLAYIDDSNQKISVLKYIDNNWTMIQSDISTGTASNIDIYTNSNEIYITYNDSGESNESIVKKLNSYNHYNIPEGTNKISQIVLNNDYSFTYDINGVDGEFFEINSSGYLSFKQAQEYNESKNEFEMTLSGINENNISVSKGVKVSLIKNHITYEDQLFSYQSKLTGVINFENNQSSLSWLNINDKNLSGTPSNDDVGSYLVSLISGSTKEIINITVVNTNDAPLAYDTNITIDEDSNISFKLDDFNISDIDLEDSINSIYISSTPLKGKLFFNNIEVTQNQNIVISNLNQLVFSPSKNENGTPYSFFKIKANDGDLNSTDANITINVRAINDEPTWNLTQKSIDINESILTRIDLSGTYSDVDTNISKITITPVSSNSTIATVVMDKDVLVITPKDGQSGVINIDLNLSDGTSSIIETISVTIQGENTIPNSDIPGQEGDGEFNPNEEASGVKPNVQNPNEYKEVVTNTNETYLVFSDASYEGKLSIMKKVGENWEYISDAFKGYGNGIATQISAKYNKRKKSMIIHFEDNGLGSLLKLEKGDL